MASDTTVVSDHDMIVDLCSFADDCGIVRPTIDRCTRSNFDVRFYFDMTKLRNELMDAGLGSISKSMAPITAPP